MRHRVHRLRRNDARPKRLQEGIGSAMNEERYRIEVDPRTLSARLTLFGLWDLATLNRYTYDVTQALAEGGAAGRYRILIDLRNHGVQSREVAAAIQSRLMMGIEQASQVAILVSPSLLHRLQAQRLGSHVQASFFADEDEALTWLTAT